MNPFSVGLKVNSVGLGTVIHRESLKILEQEGRCKIPHSTVWNGLETREKRRGVQVGGSQSKVCQRSLHRTAGVRTCKCIYNITIETSSK